MCYLFVDWVIRTTGLGIGRPDSDTSYPDACHVAEYVFSGGTRSAEYFAQLPEPEKTLEALEAHWPEFARELFASEDPQRLSDELEQLTHRSFYDAYQRERKRLKFIPCPQELRRRAMRGLEVRARLDGAARDFSVTVKPRRPPQTPASPSEVKHESESSNKSRSRVAHRARTSDQPKRP
jgi:hypothetical protein